MNKLAITIWVAFVLSLAAGVVFAQSPVAAPSPVEARTDMSTKAPVTDLDARSTDARSTDARSTDARSTDARSTDVTQPAPAPASTSTSTQNTEVWGLDGKTVLIGGALLLGIILIAVAAAGHDRDTTVVR